MIVLTYVIKIAGAILILLAGVRFGMEYRQKLKARTDFLNGVIAGLSHLEGQIVMSEEMLELGMQECGRRFFESENGEDLFTRCATKLSNGTSSADLCWIETLEEISCKDDIIQDAEISILKELAPTLGTADAEHHSTHILGVVQKLTSVYEEAENKLKRDGSLSVKLSCAVSAVLILLLW